MGNTILDRAMVLAVGERIGKKQGIVRRKIKRMSLERFSPDRDYDPGDTLKGAFIRTLPYGGGLIDLEEYEHGVLVKVPGQKPWWYFKARKNDAYGAARLATDYLKSRGSKKLPSAKYLERESATVFITAADRIEPDASRLPSPGVRGNIRKVYPYKGAKVTTYANGASITRDNGKIEWYDGSEGKRKAFEKAKLISGAGRAEKIFRD